MKKIFVGTFLILLFIAPCEATFFDIGLEFDDFKKPAVAFVAGVSSIVVGSIAYLIGSKYSDAKRIEQERFFAQEKDEREKREKREKAEKFISMMQKRYKNECSILSSYKKLTYEELSNCAAEKFNHKTAYVHLSYARQLKEDLAQFADYYYEFSEENRWYADELEEALNKVSSAHSILFKNILLTELEKEKIALADQRKQELSESIEREKLRQEILKRECYENIKKENEALDKKRTEVIALLTKHSLEKMETMANYAHIMHTNSLAAHSLMLQDIRAEFKNNGLASLVKKINGFEQQIILLNKNVAEGSREVKKITEIFEIHRNQLNQIKNEINTLRNENRLSKEQIDRMNKIIERAESTLAVISADVGDIKSGNTTGAMTAPLKESHW